MRALERASSSVSRNISVPQCDRHQRHSDATTTVASWVLSGEMSPEQQSCVSHKGRDGAWSYKAHMHEGGDARVYMHLHTKIWSENINNTWNQCGITQTANMPKWCTINEFHNLKMSTESLPKMSNESMPYASHSECHSDWRKAFNRSTWWTGTITTTSVVQR